MPSQLNFLWISLEDTSPRFGCYGDAAAKTPNLDRLALEGILYKNAFSTSGVCAPSRSCIITGCYQTSIGTHHMRTTNTNEDSPQLCMPYKAVIPHYIKIFPEYLRAAGYYCTNNNKTDYQFDPPLSAWNDCSERGHWRNRPEGTPFFSVFNLMPSHESGMWKRPDFSTNPDSVQLPPYLPDTRKTREALAKQYDNIADNDVRVGQILRQLEEDGLTENTVVFIWSDHGEGLPRAKRWPYNAGIRIPLILRWPGNVTAGAISEDVVSLIDLAPTVLSLAGIEIPLHMQGHPFLGPLAKKREYAFATRDRHDVSYDMVRAVRDKRFQYLRNYSPEKPTMDWLPYRNQHPAQQELWRLHAENKLEGAQKLFFNPTRPVEELYDLETDPWELVNLASDPQHEQLLNRMRQALDNWSRTYGDLGHVSELQMIHSMWPEGKQPQTQAPLCIPISATVYGIQTQESGTYEGPLMIQLHSSTQGASIVYQIGTDTGAEWKLYTQPFRVAKGDSLQFRAKAVRIGFKDSIETQANFVVT